MVLVEICSDNWEDTKIAIESGADRIELCSELVLDGLTPREELLEKCKREFPLVPIFVMIRCRSGDFVYNDIEKREMICIAKRFVDIGADGLVVGALTPEPGIDYEFMADFANAVRRHKPSIQITFHKAIDTVYTSSEAFNFAVASLAPFCHRILTSGGHDTALNGANEIREACKIQSAPTLIAAGGIRAHNVEVLIQRTGAHEIHSRCPKTISVIKRYCRHSGAPATNSAIVQ